MRWRRSDGVGAQAMTSHRTRLALIAGLALILLRAGNSFARPAAAQPSGQATITTNRAEYAIGDRIRICFEVPGPGHVTMTSVRDDAREVVWEADDDGSGDCLEGTIVPPAGRECLRLDWSGGGRRTSAETCIEVREMSA